jgi:hypothetical protein
METIHDTSEMDSPFFCTIGYTDAWELDRKLEYR